MSGAGDVADTQRAGQPAIHDDVGRAKFHAGTFGTVGVGATAVAAADVAVQHVAFFHVAVGHAKDHCADAVTLGAACVAAAEAG